MSKPNIFIVANPDKAEARQACDRLLQALEGKANIIGQALEGDLNHITDLRADFIIALGGDGTMLGIARAQGHQPVPIIGVNLGKLGYLAEYSVGELIDQFDRIIGSPELVAERMVLQVHVRPAQGREVFSSLALNDACLIAGPPFRMIEMEVRINGQILTHVRGDGLIFSTPTGSTAYNMSVGGPILLPKVRAIVISPSAPQSLSFRPLVVDSDSTLEIIMVSVNHGTTMLVDGQILNPLVAGDVIRIARFEKDCKIVRHIQNTPWDTLVTKLGWAQSPRYNNVAH